MTASRTLDTALIALVILLIWQGLNQWVGSTALPGPLPTLDYLGHFIPTSRFAESALTSLLTFLQALALAYAIGLGLGIWLGAQAVAGAVGEPILVAISTMPKITLYPVVLLIFGLGIGGKITFGALHGILPVALMTMAAIRNIPPVYLKSAKTLHLPRWRTVLFVLMPACMPEVVSGLRIGFTTTMVGVVLSEMFASKRGMGFLIMNAMNLIQPQEMLSVAIVLFVFAAGANALLLWAERAVRHGV